MENEQSFNRLSTFIVLIVFLLSGLHVSAFTRSEDELMRAEVQEAKARARDFKAQQKRSEQAEREREIGSGVIKAERAQAEEEQERARLRFIARRNSKPDPEVEMARLEEQFDEKKAREEIQMEASRQSYLRKRAKVEKTIEEEAYIDGNEEFGLK